MKLRLLTLAIPLAASVACAQASVPATSLSANAAPAPSEEPAGEKTKAADAKETAAKDSKAADGDKKEKSPAEADIDATVKDHEKIEGLFQLYRKKKGAADTLLLEVPKSQLRKLYLVQATASTGTSGTPLRIFQGAPLGDIPFFMELVDDSRILFLRPNLSDRAPGDPVMRRTLDRSFPHTLLGSFEIKARQKNRDSVLIDVTDFFKGDIAGVAGRFGQGPGSYAFDRPFTYFDSLKAFPENLVVRTMYKLNRSGSGEPRSIPLAISYNLSQLPETGYRPRLADARVGYFQVSFNDQSDNANYDQNVNYIQRWNLEKADPTAPLSPPKKPIRFYIDNGVPEKYRDAVRAGLLMYNKAFEEIGIKDAIVVEQMPDDAEWDIADVRYNVIRWTTGYPFAIALFRANPLTGEILNAGINMDAAFVSGGAFSFDIHVDPRRYFTQLQPEGTAKQSDLLEGYRCTYQHDSAQDAAFGLTALELVATPDQAFDREEFIKQRVTQVVAHEMGHCLGLRHNFIASKQFTLKQLGDPELVKRHGVAATVMDYLPWNIAALRNKGVPYFSQTVGSYDKWAIRYGYLSVPAQTPEEELPVLRRIASQGSLPGLLYHSDGVADAYDPYISRFDFGADPLEYAERTMQVSRYLLLNLDQRLPQRGESYYEFTRSFNSLLSRYFSVVGYSTRFIGGMQFSNSYKGDPNERPPLTPVSGAEQKRALALLNRFVFSEAAFSLPKQSFSFLGANPNNPSFEPSADERRYPMLDTLSNFQGAALRAVFAADTLNRVANNEFRTARPGDTLTLAALFREISGEVWSELRTGKEIGPLRRNLQRTHLDLLIGLVTRPAGSTPRDAVSLGWAQLRDLRKQVAQAVPTAKGEYARPHLEETLLRIDRVLNASSVIN